MVPTPAPTIEIRIDATTGKIDRNYDPDVMVSPGDQVTWTCKGAPFMVYETASRVCGIQSQCLHPDTPFGSKMHRPSNHTAAGGVIISQTVRPEAKGHLYKMTWEVRLSDGTADVYDPHIIVR